MHPAFDLVSFVARSPNRTRALLSLSEGSRTRPALQEETGVPRATLSRILADFRDRELVDRSGHEYALTPLGERLASALRGLLDEVGSARALQSVSRWLPLSDLGVGLYDLSGVRVTLPTPVDPMAPVSRAAAAIEGAEHVRGFCYSVVHAPILAECRNVTERGHRFEGVIASGVLEVVSGDPALSARLRTVLEDDNADLYLHEGDIEPQLIIAGGTTMFLATDGEGAIRGLVEIRDPAIVPWAEETFATIKADAKPLDTAAASRLLGG